MKKAFALLLTLALVLGLMAGCNSTPAGPDSTTNNNTASVITKVALVTDVGTIDDESFNQAC